MSPRTLRKYNSTARLDTGSSDSPPGSPSAYRRTNSREEAGGKNVFSRCLILQNNLLTYSPPL